MSEVKTPWKDYMGDVPMHLDYFQGSMFEAVERMADMYPNSIAFDFTPCARQAPYLLIGA